MTYKTTDGNTATAEIAYKLSEVCAIYPITPSSTMAEMVEQWSSEGKLNIFGDSVLVKEMQSEAGVSGAIHGALSLGAVATTFTSSQGLLLMIPNMYKIAGECLPCVIHVSARAIATHSLSIFGDHSDVMAVRSTGFNILSSSSVQECYDMALACHILTLKTSIPIIHFFDGFRTSHEVQKIQTLSDEEIKEIYPFFELEKFKQKALDNSPIQKGTSQNPDVFFQNRESCNPLYLSVFDKLLETFSQIEKITQRKYSPYEFYGSKSAKYVAVCMGSCFQTMKETVDFLNKNVKNEYGVVNVRLYRPFFGEQFAKVLPKSVQKIVVLDRTKESGSVGEPLYTDVCSSILENGVNAKVIGGRYGLGGKEFNISHGIAVFENLACENPKNHFTVGINDDVTNTSLSVKDIDLNENSYNLKFYGLGSDGTVSANKNSIKIISQATDNFVQGYFEYDSKKSGSLTTSYLRISPSPINKPYKPKMFDFIAIHNFTFISRYNLIFDLKQNGTVLVNTNLNSQDLGKFLPKDFIFALKQKNAKLYIINAQKIANDVNLGGKINVIMQTAFFKLQNFVPFDVCLENIKKTTISTYSKKGDDIVQKNLEAIELAQNGAICVDYSNFEGANSLIPEKTSCKFFDEIISKIESMQGENLPVSAFTCDGSVPTDTSKYLKRGIAQKFPHWVKENCIQCGICSLVCPHSAIRSVLISEKNDTNKNFETIDALGEKGKKFRIQVSPKDCTGCGVCVNSCPALKKALLMQDASVQLKTEQENFKYSQTVPKEKSIFNKFTTKGVQFCEPYFEYSYACAGCGETPYIKLLTQLFGENMIIANATGCSSIYGGSYPVCPYSKDKNGNGPSWANSLFEDNAEFGYGFSLALSQKAKHEKDKTKKSVWIIGGDGWAYDIGYGGVDHILHSKENVNILVLDTEVYSNTGGQSSKSTPLGSVVKFNANGEKTSKKDLGAIAMTTGNCYVASISLGANPNQTIKAFKEAEQFDGPSLIIAYCHCINHGFDMSKSNEHMKLCVECGYWNLYRYNPTQDKPLTVDSSMPTKDYKEFLLSETRYQSLQKKDKQRAEEIYEQSKIDAQKRYKNLLNILKNQE